MSERRMAEKHEWVDGRAYEVRRDGAASCGTAYGATFLLRELLRIVYERDSLLRGIEETAAFWEDRASGMLHEDHEQLCREAAASIRLLLGEEVLRNG